MKTVALTLAATLGIVAAPALAGPAHNPKNPEDVQATEAQRGGVPTRAPAHDPNTPDEVQASDTQRRGPGAEGKAETTWKIEKGETAAAARAAPRVRVSDGATQASAKPFRQEGGTTVPTADDVLAPSEEETTRPARRLSQNGTTVATASNVQASEAQRGGAPR